MTIMKYDACPNKKLFFFRKFTMLQRTGCLEMTGICWESTDDYTARVIKFYNAASELVLTYTERNGFAERSVFS